MSIILLLLPHLTAFFQLRSLRNVEWKDYISDNWDEYRWKHAWPDLLLGPGNILNDERKTHVQERVVVSIVEN